MFSKKVNKYIGVACISCAFTACKVPALMESNAGKTLPANYGNTQDTTNSGRLKWGDYFKDADLKALIDTALKNNQELNITLQELEVAKNEIKARKGEYLPSLRIKAGAGFDKVGRYTNIGASEANTEIKPGTETPEPLPDYLLAAQATWEVDVWKKLRNAKKASITRYLSTQAGRNFVITNLIAEVANSYYELLALDNQLAIVDQNIQIQTSALRVVKIQQEATRVTKLAVRKFEAEVLNTQGLRFDILQKIRETENRINYLLGRYPQPIKRDDQAFQTLLPDAVHAGIPAQLLSNRPDIKQAELDMIAAKLDIKVAKAQFYPSVSLSAAIGYNAYNPAYLITTPTSLIYSLLGDITAPIINRNAIKAAYYNANARQIQSVYNYQQKVLRAYLEVANQMSNIDNLQKHYDLKQQEVAKLTESINISNNLFRSTRADYMEVLLTQRDALESKFELIEMKVKQMNAVVNIYHALGGGWDQ